ncbi:universal stress protein [Pendulispora albinea]|uniref:Universal stress protein n=1 Tax=Pendulispora albinea TaxID=2741071 RepID=A0ABZ2LIW6_9BACT
MPGAHGRSGGSGRGVEAFGAAAAAQLVMGTHGRQGIARMLLGSVAERVVRTAPCPVLTVAPADPDEA